ncbi:apolipoprotein N-acyltransferase [Pseudomonas sp. RTC3]|uniref:apolipoprotein N-acyltransferase n=1 Tax=unclassified Pseudomonas TaxID=196821 RepID=UPI002AB4EAA8|nr:MULTISPECIES: apolipoprotein N-acyltransferase [unclassified Pseudomonas]MEB0061618.1 apolipoprotein N-acyltransferase [Pseudomonas sp. RTC3]MDY7566607.1 apolipoprotein N-acyltransferase [Pseudomonas sp. 5C2]MEB0005772.1 apolipoprotein N-acyltransferase [Pseudomonas sp. RTB2]MEB0016883.1 apolipoprotein N-acyltransferase [Pseudomonas sp. RTB3]MEB0024975.1 apolipoprotein N-acyltransferase [Pseudomonas sp. MH9.2]
MRWITRPGWPGNLLAMAAGAITTLALAPFDIWPLALVSLVVFYLGLREVNPRQALGRGWCYGFGLFGAGTSWIYVSIHTYGEASALLAGFLMLAFIAAIALFFALPAWIWTRWIRRNEAPLADALAFAALWLAQEAFRGWFLTGFPWLYSGYSQLDGPLSGLAPMGGMWLVSFTLALTAALLCNLPRLRARKAFLGAGVLLLLAPWALSLALKNHEWTSPAGPPLSVAAIQGNVEQSMKWDPAQLNAQLALYRDMTFRSRRADLIIWPETAIPVLKESAEGFLTMLGRFAADRDSALITGVPLRQRGGHGEYHYYNAITVAGEGDGTYLKQKLVPFGEYVPLQDLLRGLITFFNLPMSDFARGPSDQALLQAKGYQIAPYICYEVVYPEFAAGLAAQSELLLTVSNDTWFGTSIGPLQHLQMAQMRALEAGRWMIRATNNGVSGLINPFGKITATIPQFQQGILYGDVVPMHELTPYLRWRSWPLTIFCVFLFGWALLAGRIAKTV